MSEGSSHIEFEWVEFSRSIDVRAPDDLHRRIAALIGRQSSWRRRLPIGKPVSAGLPLLARRAVRIAVTPPAAAALMLGLSSGGSSAFTLDEASALTLGAATMAAPPENPTRQDELTRSVDGVAFPYWEDSHGWRSTGARIDRISGRWVTTVFYANSRGQRIGYAIVAGAPAPKLSGGALIWRSDRPYRLLAEKGVQLVAWNRDGHLCILGARGVSSAELLRLAG